MPDKNDKHDLLVKYLKGRLIGDQKKEFEKMLEDDPELKRTARFVSDLLNESREIEWDKFKKPAHSVFGRMLKDYKTSQKEKDGMQGIMIFDSRDLPPPEGVRRAMVGARRLKYHVGEDILEISLYPISPASYEMIGQLSGLVPGKIIQVEVREGRKIKKSSSNKFQLFRFDRIEAGKYVMKIYLEQKIIAKIDIEL